MTIRTILVGTDGSESARRAVAWAGEFAERVEGEVTVVSALGLLTHLHGETLPSSGHRSEVEHLLETEWSEPVRTGSVRHHVTLRDGTPVTVLLTVADEIDADLIVVGRRGGGGFPALLLGSTSAQVAQHARRPVVIVP